MTVRPAATLLALFLLGPLIACGDEGDNGANGGNGTANGSGNGTGNGGGGPPVPGLARILFPDGEDFVAPTDETELTLEPGSQGGFHIRSQIYIDAVARNALGEIVLQSREMRRTRDEALVSKSAFNVQWVPAGDGGFQLNFETFIFLCPTPIDVGVADEELVLRVELGDPEFVTPLVTTATVTVRCPDGDQAPFCDQICRG